MKTITKCPLLMVDHQIIKIAEGSNIINVGMDSEGKLCLWVVLEYETRECEVDIYILRTGAVMSDKCFVHCGTLKIDGDMWHVFVSEK